MQQLFTMTNRNIIKYLSLEIVKLCFVTAAYNSKPHSVTYL